MRTFGAGWISEGGDKLSPEKKKTLGELDGTSGVSFMELNMVQRFGRMLKNPSWHRIPAPEPSTEPQNSRPEASDGDESFNHGAQPVCEGLDEELNPPDALPAKDGWTLC